MRKIKKKCLAKRFFESLNEWRGELEYYNFGNYICDKPMKCAYA
jgi:hypothetical protein